MKCLKPLLLSLSLSTLLAPHCLYATPLTAQDLNALAVVAVIDQHEIVLGDIALHNSTDGKVINLANMMVTQHTENLIQLLSMIKTPSAFLHALANRTPIKLDKENSEEILSRSTRDISSSRLALVLERSSGAI